ncbi:MAG: hypothetical protein WBV45_13715, partial [Lutimonas sp.]
MKEDKKLEKLIRENLKVETTSDDFSDKIMKQIKASDKKEEIALSSLVTKYAVESPSVNFTSKVMSGIQNSPSIVINPVIIGKKAWIVIAALLSAFVYYVISSSGSGGTETAAYAELMEGVGDRFNQAGSSLSSQLPEILTNPIFALSMFALSTLLLLDYMLKRRKVS